MNFERHAELWGYELVSANVQTSERDAEVIAELVSRSNRFNKTTQIGPLSCRCTRRNKCTDDGCPNRKENFECFKCGVGCLNQQVTNLANIDFVPPVTIQARGGYAQRLVALRKIEPNELIGELIGRYVTYPPGTTKPPSLYAYKIETNESRPEDRVIALDMSTHSNEFRFASHDCNPNCETHLVKVGREFRIGVWSTRAIEKSNPVTLNFGFEYFSEGFVCHCDSCKEKKSRQRFNESMVGPQRGRRQQKCDEGQEIVGHKNGETREADVEESNHGNHADEIQEEVPQGEGNEGGVVQAKEGGGV